MDEAIAAFETRMSKEVADAPKDLAEFRRRKWLAAAREPVLFASSMTTRLVKLAEMAAANMLYLTL